MKLNFILEVPIRFYLTKRCGNCLHADHHEFVDEKGMVAHILTRCEINDKPTEEFLEVSKSNCIAYDPVDDMILRVNDYKELI